MSEKQAVYAAKRVALTRPQLRAWVADMVALGEPAAPAVFNCQQDERDLDAGCHFTAEECEDDCRCARFVSARDFDRPLQCVRCGGIAQPFDPAATIHDPGSLRDAWMAGRDAAAYAALRAAVDGACGLAIASRAALVMPDAGEVEL